MHFEKQFNSFFVSYTRSFNNFYKTKGHLFDSPFKRISVTDEIHLVQLVVYIHANAIRHRVRNSFSEYSWLTYNRFIKGEVDDHILQSVMSWFGDKERFEEIHQLQSDYYYKFDE